MKRFRNYGVMLGFIFLSTGVASADNDNGTSFLSGTGHAQITHDLSDNTAGTFAFEAGSRNNRVSGTLGWEINPRNRIKATGEWLWQDIDYSFLSGSTRQWVNQGAAGLAYQYAFNDKFENYFNLSGYYSHAPSENLSTRTFTTIDPLGDLLIVNNLRRIAGSNAGGISPGITTHLWEGGEVTLALNWDDVKYDTKYRSNVTANGVGGTAGVSQLFRLGVNDYKAGATGAWRAPFNNYRAEIDWIQPYTTSALLVGLFGDYTHGKKSLPNTSLVGVNVTYAMDAPPKTTLSPRAQSFTAWMTEPAVYMPQVLAIPDQAILLSAIPSCPAGFAPAFIGPAISSPTGTPTTLTVRPLFSGNNPTFSVTTSGFVPASHTATITATTGILTIQQTRSGTVTVTATNRCGSASTSFRVNESN